MILRLPAENENGGVSLDPNANFPANPSFPNASIGSATWLRTDSPHGFGRMRPSAHPSYGGNPGKPELDPRLKHSGVTSLRVAIPFHFQPNFQRRSWRGRAATNNRNISRKDAKAAKEELRTWRSWRLGASKSPSLVTQTLVLLRSGNAGGGRSGSTMSCAT
jgi:hypothetical protein